MDIQNSFKNVASVKLESFEWIMQHEKKHLVEKKRKKIPEQPDSFNWIWLRLAKGDIKWYYMQLSGHFSIFSPTFFF